MKSVNVVDSLKSVAKSFKGAHHTVFRVLAEWLELDRVSHQRQALTDKKREYSCCYKRHFAAHGGLGFEDAEEDDSFRFG